MKKKIKTLLLATLAMLGTQGVQAQSNAEEAVLSNIMTRTSIRKYQQRPVETDKQEKLLRAAMASPSSRNMQPWHFVVLNDEQNISQLAAGLRNNEMIKGAPLAIIVCGDTTRMQSGQARDFWIEDVSAASENILLAAHAMGLGAVWTSVYPVMGKVKGFTHALKLPGNLIPFNCILIGYPAEQPEVQDKWDTHKITYNIP
ncbi:MAG: nitroreductase family protein [Prevotella sp.]|nr:nitroreductase family protein [Prevotella sp.]